MSKRQGFSFLITLLLSMLALPGMAQDLADVEAAASGLSFTPNQATGFVLTVSAPDGTVARHGFAAGQAPALATGGFADGIYTWELTPVAAPRDRDGQAPAETLRVGQSGSFSVLGGSLVTGGEERVEVVKRSDFGGSPLTKDQIILDDLIVDGSACIGFDCVNGESFGFDTIRLKENNLRIKFQDTSSSASFPSRDWQLTVNDSSNGGLNKFSIDDIDGGRTPFTIEAGAPSHSLYVDDGGRLGLGTATPAVDAHIVTGNTPTLRLEQNGSSGFTPQTWDVAGNEANFFIRDATNGSTLPFRIRPGAPSSSIDIEGSTGDVGFGSTAPEAPIHIRRTNGLAKLLVEEASGTEALRNVVELKNNGTTRIQFQDTSADGTIWANAVAGANFTISQNGTSAAEFEITDQAVNGTGAKVRFRRGTEVIAILQANGNLVLDGVVSMSSDRNVKTNIAPVDARDVLARVTALPLATWTYKNDLDSPHLGPMAQDFYAAFGLDQDDKHIAPSDLSGVALAAIQGLNSELEARDEQIDQLKTRNDDLEARLATLEAMVEAIANSNN